MGSAFLYLVLLALPRGAVTAASSGILRREDGRSHEVTTVLDSDGRLVEVKAHTAHELAQGPEPDGSISEEDCDQEPILGLADSNNCSDMTKHALIIDKATCERAMILSGGKKDEVMGFDIADGTAQADENQDRHPSGCFISACGSVKGHKVAERNDFDVPCFYFNQKEWPAHPGEYGGTPVCFRDRYLNGSTYTNGKNEEEETWNDDESCPEGYQVVMNETQCRSTAVCLGMKQAEEFRVGTTNHSENSLYPIGCFQLADDDMYMFNPEIYEADGTRRIPTAATGIPVCNVSKTLKFPGKANEHYMAKS